MPSYIRHWCIFSHYEIQYKSSSISNMVSEPLLWPFLSNLVFISVTPFSTSLPPSQQPPQPFVVEPPTSPNRCPWVPDLQPPSLRSFTLHRPLPFASSLQTMLRLRYWKYHRDRLAPIYKIVKALTPSETARTPTHHSKFLYDWSGTPHTSTRRLFRSRAVMRLLTSSTSALAYTIADITCLHQLLTLSFDSEYLTVDFSRLTVDFDRALTLTVDFSPHGWLF